MEDELWEKFRLVVDAGQTPLRIDTYLSTHIANLSRNRVQNAIEADNVLVNGATIKSSYKVKADDIIQILLNHEPIDYSITPENIPLNVVYEDDSIMVINKNAGLVVHPGHGHYEHTLLHALAYHFEQEGLTHTDINNPEIGLVHRIDKDTSGLLLIAKTPFAKSALGKQFYDHTTERTYNALIWGCPKEESGTIETGLIRDVKDRTRFTTCPLTEDYPQAKRAVTHWRILKKFAYVTLIECRLETGRTHQIRVHMQSIDHPLFADEKYGGKEVRKGVNSGQYKDFVNQCFTICGRQALHAKTLGFVHPITKEKMHFDSDFPTDMSNLLNKWKEYER